MALSMDDFYEKNKNVNQVKNISDGWHTFQDLYDHRKALTAMIVSLIPNHSWKSKKHDDEENDPMFDGMFIVGIDLPAGTITYHYDLEDWDLFHCQELPTAKKWDGASPEDTVTRLIESLL